MRFCYSIFFSAIFVGHTIQCAKPPGTIREAIIKYFNSASVKEFGVEWNLFSRAFDNAMTTTLGENYDDNVLNIYMPINKKNRIISHGLYSSDGSINLLCLNMVLRALPRISAASVNVALPSNVLRVEGLIEKMFIDTQYKLYRNYTSVLDQGEQDPYRNSPFTFQQVQGTGDLAVIVEDCSLIGTVVSTLVGASVSLGQDTLRLADCKFSVEISSLGLAEPPVIAPYFSSEKGIELMQLLSKPISEYLMALLQGAALSYINTTDVFSNKLGLFWKAQRYIIKLTRDFTTELVSNINRITIRKNQGTLKLPDLKISLYQMVNGSPELSFVQLKNVTVSGVETAYSANTGGPIRMKVPFLSEEICFNSLQVRGNLLCENQTISATSNFAAELLDFTVSLIVNLPQIGTSRAKFAPKGWRSVQFSIINLDGFSTSREEAYSLIVGYLSDNIPKVVVKYLTGVYEEADKMTEKEGAYKDDSKPMQEDTIDTKKNEVVSNDQLETLDLDESRGLLSDEFEERQKHRRSVVSQSEHEDKLISRKRDSKRNLGH